MKSFVKIFGIVVLVAAVGFGFTACGDDNGGFRYGDFGTHGYFFWAYEITSPGIIITRYDGPGGDVEIPRTIRGGLVETIGIGAFENSDINNITIPNSVVWILGSAFADNNLASITIPNSVGLIEINAFKGNPLTSITIGANVEVISMGGAFGNNGFEDAYSAAAPNNGGTWTRPNVESTEWTRQ